jgi:hypothetical protein
MKESEMADQETKEERDAQYLRISHGIHGVFLALIGILSLVAAVAYVALNGNTTTTTGLRMANGSPMMSGTAAAPTGTVTVAMHDPGCHWFKVGNGYKKTVAVGGPVSVLNADEAAIKIAGANGVQTDAVGSNVTVAPGTYRVTMVGQASDDNTLRLTVS